MCARYRVSCDTLRIGMSTILVLRWRTAPRLAVSFLDELRLASSSSTGIPCFMLLSVAYASLPRFAGKLGYTRRAVPRDAPARSDEGRERFVEPGGASIARA